MTAIFQNKDYISPRYKSWKILMAQFRALTQSYGFPCLPWLNTFFYYLIIDFCQQIIPFSYYFMKQ